MISGDYNKAIESTALLYLIPNSTLLLSLKYYNIYKIFFFYLNITFYILLDNIVKGAILCIFIRQFILRYIM